MTELPQAEGEKDNIESVKPHSENSPRTNLIWFVFVFVAVLLLIIVVSFGFKESADQMNFLTVNILSLFALAVVIASAITANKQWEVMRNQEMEMTHQRKIMQGQLDAMKSQLEMMAVNECAYISFGDWELHTTANEIIIEGSIHNGGSTPSFNLEMSFQITLGEGEPPEDLSIDWSKCPPGPPRMVIAGETTSFSPGAIEVTQSQIDLMYEGKLRMLLDGRCSYSDSLGGIQVYEVGYFFEMREERHRAIERYKKYSRISKASLKV
jgi:hypothetical protein